MAPRSATRGLPRGSGEPAVNCGTAQASPHRGASAVAHVCTADTRPHRVDPRRLSGALISTDPQCCLSPARGIPALPGIPHRRCGFRLGMPPSASSAWSHPTDTREGSHSRGNLLTTSRVVPGFGHGGLHPLALRPGSGPWDSPRLAAILAWPGSRPDRDSPSGLGADPWPRPAQGRRRYSPGRAGAGVRPVVGHQPYDRTPAPVRSSCVSVNA